MEDLNQPKNEQEQEQGQEQEEEEREKTKDLKIEGEIEKEVIDEKEEEEELITIEVKWRNNLYFFSNISPSKTTISLLKELISNQTFILPSKIKIFGLISSEKTLPNDNNLLIQYKKQFKNNKLNITIMGTPEQKIQEFELKNNQINNVFNDFSSKR